MRLARGPRVAACALWLSASGCTALREIPRTDYGAEPERKHVRLVTQDGLEYEFDYVTVENDTLVGYRERPVEGPNAEFVTLRVPVEEIARLSARRVDWYRTGLVGGSMIAALVAAGLTSKSDEPQPGNSGGGGPRLP